MIIHTPANREQWLALRKPVVTSTEVSALFGYCPYLTALELALLKTGQIEDDFEENDRTTWGTRLQDSIAAGIAHDYGVDVRPMKEFITCDDARIGASFDWRIVGVNAAKCDDQSLRLAFAEHGDGILEIKNVDSLAYRDKWIDDTPPVHIELQVQQEIECAGVQWGVVAALVGGNRAKLTLRQRYEEVIISIRDRVGEFWTNLEKGIMPAADMPEDAETIRRLYNFAEPGKLADLRGNAQATEWARLYKAASDDIKEATDRKDVARAELLQIIGDAEKALVDGFSISAGMIGPTPIAYTRAGYRDFRVFEKKAKK